MRTNEPSRFNRDLKLEALSPDGGRGEVSVLARELGVSRKGIYQCVIAIVWTAATPCASRGRMTKAERVAREEALTAEKQAATGIKSIDRKREADDDHASFSIDLRHGMHVPDSQNFTIAAVGQLWLKSCDALERPCISLDPDWHAGHARAEAINRRSPGCVPGLLSSLPFKVVDAGQ